jgi:hypothetical protein
VVKTIHKHLVGATILLGAIAFTYSAHSADFDAYRQASNQELDSMRGGFEVPIDGQQILLSLGIERVTFINGELAAVTPVSDLHFQLIQNGPGNSFSPPSSVTLPPETLTLIQNSLDNQTIRNLTLINASVGFKDMVRSQTVSSALTESRLSSQP